MVWNEKRCWGYIKSNPTYILFFCGAHTKISKYREYSPDVIVNWKSEFFVENEKEKLKKELRKLIHKHHAQGYLDMLVINAHPHENNHKENSPSHSTPMHFYTIFNFHSHLPFHSLFYNSCGIFCLYTSKITYVCLKKYENTYNRYVWFKFN